MFEKINNISQKCGLGTPEIRGSLGGSDAAYITEAGIPVIDGLGIKGDSIHTINEKAEIASMAESADFIVAIIENFAKER